MAEISLQDSYRTRRGEIAHYFDRTAAAAWSRLTSDAPLGRIRATVRAGRDQMRATLLDWLPTDLRGRRILDAGCGTGAFAVEAARRGASVVALDLSPTLISLARERMPTDLGSGEIEFRAGDMRDTSLGHFDHIVAMDSLIHYGARDSIELLATLASQCGRSVVFTFVPKTAALAAMHAVGRLFPRGDRAPDVAPVTETTLRRVVASEVALTSWRIGRTKRIASGFYTSQAMELVRR
jgi:magnesium-protoporphyrin O-methyltransferase